MPREFERPANAGGRYVYRLPETKIPVGSQITVDSDTVAMVLDGRKVLVVLPPGRHVLADDHAPLKASLDKSAGVFNVEILFVKTTPIRDVPIISPVDPVRDPLLFSDVTPVVSGKFDFVIINPPAMFEVLFGQDHDLPNDRIDEYIGGQVGALARDVANALGRKLKKSFLQLPPMNKELVAGVLEESTVGSHWEGPHEKSGFAVMGVKLLKIEVALSLSDADKKVLTDAGRKKKR